MHTVLVSLHFPALLHVSILFVLVLKLYIPNHLSVAIRSYSASTVDFHT